METQKKHPRSYSFEFFPPKTDEGVAKLRAAWSQLAQLKPRFFSVTYGAGGSTRERTLGTVLEIRQAGHAAAPHLSCIGSSRADITATLDLYKSKGIRHIVALRGDLPSGTASSGELAHANELVELIRAHTGDWFDVEVACYPEFHPQAKSPGDDLAHFKRKVEAGANAAITQYFYNADCLLPLRRRVRGARPRSPDRPGHHADRQLQPARALLGRLRRRDPALDPPQARRASATTPPRSAASGSTSSPTSATVCSRRAPPACTSTP